MADYKVFAQQQILVNDDAELATGVLATTFADRLAVTEARFTPASGKIPDGSLQARLFKTLPGFNAGRGGTLELDDYFCGAGADVASGALPTPIQYRMMRDGLGGGNASQVGGVAGASATAIAMPNATGTRVRGGPARVGQLKDGRALGQPTVFGDPTTDLLVALPAAPNAGDVIRPGLIVYPTETLGPVKRFRLMWGQTNMCYDAHGCQLAGLRLTFAHGALPRRTWIYGVQYWLQVDGVTFPDATAMAGHKPSITGAGSYVLAPLGQTTRNTLRAPEIEITLNLGLAPITGPMGIDIYHQVTDWIRIKGSPDEPAGTLRLTAPWSDVFGDNYDPDGADANLYHFLFGLSAGEGTAATEGRHVLGYCPQVRYMGDRPGPMVWQGLTGTSLMFALDEGQDETNDLTRSFIRMALT